MLLQRRIRRMIAQKEISRSENYHSSKIAIWFQQRRLKNSIDARASNEKEMMADDSALMEREQKIDITNGGNGSDTPSTLSVNIHQREKDLNSIEVNLDENMISLRQSTGEHIQNEIVAESADNFCYKNDQGSPNDDLSTSVIAQVQLAKIIRGYITHRRIYSNLLIVRAAKGKILRGKQRRRYAAIIIQCHVRCNFARKKVQTKREQRMICLLELFQQRTRNIHLIIP